MSKKKRMQYKGPSRDIHYNPWMRLVHGRHYMVEVHEFPSGKIRLKIWDDIDMCRETYSSKADFESEWC